MFICQYYIVIIVKPYFALCIIGVFRDPGTGRTMSLQEAVKLNLIDGKTVTILDPTNGQKVDLDLALENGVMDGTTGQVKAG